jgi:hypothetical protein
MDIFRFDRKNYQKLSKTNCLPKSMLLAVLALFFEFERSYQGNFWIFQFLLWDEGVNHSCQ